MTPTPSRLNNLNFIQIGEEIWLILDLAFILHVAFFDRCSKKNTYRVWDEKEFRKRCAFFRLKLYMEGFIFLGFTEFSCQIKASQLICSINHLGGFHMIEKLI